MTYIEQGTIVRLEMTRNEFEEFLLVLGFAAGAALREPDQAIFWRWINFANEVNRTNPRFTPYEIPAKYQQNRQAQTSQPPAADGGSKPKEGGS